MLKSTSPVVVMRSANRETIYNAQYSNISAGKAVAEIVKSTLGPNSLLKMLLDPLGGLVLTNDGNAILREIDVSHPAAKSLIELSRSQDEETGDGTTSVIIIAGELLAKSEPLLKEMHIHPTKIIQGYNLALDDALECMKHFAKQINMNDQKELDRVVQSCAGTKFSSVWGDIITSISIKAVKQITIDHGHRKEIDIKRYIKIEKLPGGEFHDCCALDGVLVNKDVTHGQMQRRIVNPKILLLDCTLEYKKGESQTNVEITDESGWEKILQQEEEEVRKFSADIISTGCNVVITEKGVSDLAQHFLLKAGISCIRRVRKSDNNRIARACGATIVNRTDEATAQDLGLESQLFEVRKIGDEYFTFITKCRNPKACTIMLRGGTKDVLNEVERNMLDAINVVRNILLDGYLLPGGGATELELHARLMQMSLKIEGAQQIAYRTVANALLIIPRVLAINSGKDALKIVTKAKAAHITTGDGYSPNIGIDGVTGEVIDTERAGIIDTYTVKSQVMKSAIESCCMLLRIDEILSGTRGSEKQNDGEKYVPED